MRQWLSASTTLCLYSVTMQCNRSVQYDLDSFKYYPEIWLLQRWPVSSRAMQRCLISTSVLAHIHLGTRSRSNCCDSDRTKLLFKAHDHKGIWVRRLDNGTCSNFLCCPRSPWHCEFVERPTFLVFALTSSDAINLFGRHCTYIKHSVSAWITRSR